ncbi:MAG: hypothetical protein HS124_03555 [Anaerolineales bacterium]|nr:hypothetical protein [Anaerolineales bacterium]
MKRLAFLAVGALAMACLPISSIPAIASPTATLQETPTVFPTLVEVDTETPLPSHTPAALSPTATSTVKATSTAPNLTVTFATSTDVAATDTATIVAPVTPSSTSTAVILKHGTLPPAIPFTTITLWNRSKAQAYISLQATTIDGYHTILEYPVRKQVKVDAPLGSYLYVAWVGGRQMVGSFRLSNDDNLIIMLFKDKVTVIVENP